jgi:hypothetical protein
MNIYIYLKFSLIVVKKYYMIKILYEENINIFKIFIDSCEKIFCDQNII